MQCPHCGVDLKFKERGGRRCSVCRREFAFEPRGHSLRLTDKRFRLVTEKLSANGALRYTPAQLQHALSRKIIAEQKPTNIGCLIIFSIVFGLAAGVVIGSVFQPLIGVIAFMLVAGGGLFWSARQHRRPFYHSLPMQLNTFYRDVIDRWQQVYGSPPTGLIDRQMLQHLCYDTPAPDRLRAVLACPERSVLDCLCANGLPERLGLGLIPAAPPSHKRRASHFDQGGATDRCVRAGGALAAV